VFLILWRVSALDAQDVAADAGSFSIPGFRGILGLVDHARYSLFDFARGLIELSLILQALIVRQSTNRFLHSAFDHISCSTHKLLLWLDVSSALNSALRMAGKCGRPIGSPQAFLRHMWLV
jgi:hypothetical protein